MQLIREGAKSLAKKIAEGLLPEAEKAAKEEEEALKAAQEAFDTKYEFGPGEGQAAEEQYYKDVQAMNKQLDKAKEARNALSQAKLDLEAAKKVAAAPTWASTLLGAERYTVKGSLSPLARGIAARLYGSSDVDSFDAINTQDCATEVVNAGFV